MNKFFKMIGVLCISLCAVFLSACSTITYGVYIYDDGSIAQVYNISLDNTQMTQANVNTADILNRIDTTIENYKNNLLDGKDCTGVNFEVLSETYSRTIKISFANISAYNRIYEIDTSSTQPPTIVDGLFFNKQILYEGNSPYSTLKDSELFNQFFDYITTTYMDGNASATTQYLSSIKVMTSRIYPTSYRTNANANYHKTNNGYDIYVWESDLATELSETPQQLQIWRATYSTANRLAWYGTAIALTILIGLILFFVLYHKQKTNSKGQSNTNNQSPEQNFPPTLYIQNLNPQSPDENNQN